MPKISRRSTQTHRAAVSSTSSHSSVPALTSALTTPRGGVHHKSTVHALSAHHPGGRCPTFRQAPRSRGGAAHCHQGSVTVSRALPPRTSPGGRLSPTACGRRPLWLRGTQTSVTSVTYHHTHITHHTSHHTASSQTYNS